MTNSPQDKPRRRITSNPVVRALIAVLAAALALFAYLAILVIAGVVYGLALWLVGKGVSEDVTATVTYFSSIAGNVTALSGLCLILVAAKRKILPTLSLRPFPLTAVIPCISLGFFYNVFASTALTLAISCGAFSNSVVKSFEALYSESPMGNPVIYFLAVAVVTPIAEEVFFRSVSYRYMSNRMNKILAVVLSAVFFGIAHGNLIAFVYTFVLGIILAVLFEKSGSVLLPIVIHASFNASSLLTPYLDGLFQKIDPSLIFVCIVSGIVSAALTVLTLFLLRRGNIKPDKIQTGDIES